LLPLIQGPDRLPNLKSLALDAIYGEYGTFVDVDDDLAAANLSLDETWWIEPDWTMWEIPEVEELLEVAEANGVDVEGEIFEALEVEEGAEVERGNRLVLRMYHTKSFQEYLDVQNERPSPVVRLPSIDIDSLDPEKLKLVKTDLPEVGWYQLSLE
jgi:hypothetical protein